MSASDHDTIVLIHGFGANRLAMFPMAHRFGARGFQVENFGYFSLASIQTTSQQLKQRLQHLEQKLDTGQQHSGRIHIVAHSMGCVLTRQALLDYRPRQLGRVVMMTPPSKGSPRADILAPALGWLIKPLQELKTSPDSLVNQLPGPDYPFSLIRASHDFLVPASYERLSGAEDQWLLKGMHSYVLFSPAAIDRIIHYLETGHFQDMGHARSAAAS